MKQTIKKQYKVVHVYGMDAIALEDALSDMVKDGWTLHTLTDESMVLER